jgi:hypothetical protein
MFILYLFLLLINLSFAFEPSCTTCKFFIPHETHPNKDLGLCKMFQDKLYTDNSDKLVKNLAIHCRNNENLCGKAGFLYEPIADHNEIFEKYENAENMCSAEFTDKKDLEELEQIERDILDIFQKMRKHNTNRVYRTSKDLYKLFKKDKK